MTNIDALSVDLFEQAKRFLEKAADAKGQEGESPFCNAALLLGFSSLEAHVNAIADELALRSSIGVLEQSILMEREYRLDAGQFELTDKLKMYRLEDRIQFILANFSAPGTTSSTTWWSNLKAGIKLRNQLVHPKSEIQVKQIEVANCLSAILDCLNHLYLSVFKKPYPSFNRGLHSSLSF